MIRWLIILLLIVGCVFAQQYEVVVILQNGSEIHGIIIEEKLNEYIKIQSGKNVFVFEFEEIELLTKELVSDKTWSFAGGFGTNRSLSLLGISKDFRIGNNLSVFLSAGFPLVAVGLGFVHQSNYNNNGTNISATLRQVYAQASASAGRQQFFTSKGGVASYQWRLGKQGFISAGLMLGIHPDAISICDTNGLCTTDINYREYIFPMVAFDFRF